MQYMLQPLCRDMYHGIQQIQATWFEIYATFQQVVQYTVLVTWAWVHWHRVLYDAAYAHAFVRRTEAIGVVPIKLMQFTCNTMNSSTALYACVRSICLSNVCVHTHEDTMYALRGTDVLQLIESVPEVHAGSGSIAQT
jgi:hypothetical protein